MKEVFVVPAPERLTVVGMTLSGRTLWSANFDVSEEKAQKVLELLQRPETNEKEEPCL